MEFAFSGDGCRLYAVVRSWFDSGVVRLLLDRGPNDARRLTTRNANELAHVRDPVSDIQGTRLEGSA